MLWHPILHHHPTFGANSQKRTRPRYNSCGTSIQQRRAKIRQQRPLCQMCPTRSPRCNHQNHHQTAVGASLARCILYVELDYLDDAVHPH